MSLEELMYLSGVLAILVFIAAVAALILRRLGARQPVLGGIITAGLFVIAALMLLHYAYATL